MSAPLLYPLGRQTLQWVLAAGQPRRAMAYRWQAFWFDLNLSLSQNLHPTTGATLLPPLFILGLWRTASTFLHEALSLSPGLVAPRTWQCLNASTFRLRGCPTSTRRMTRPMDGLTIDAFTPQEDEFALLSLGAPSVYRGFLDPRRLAELTPLLEAAFWEEDGTAWLEPWRDFLAGVTASQPGRLVLKSPPHTFRIQRLWREFPGAAYIWLVRDPLTTWLSNRRMWTSMIERYALWQAPPAVLDNFLAQALDSAGRCLQTATARLEPRDLVVIEYGDLVARPRQVLGALHERLGLASRPAALANMAPLLERAKNHQPHDYPATAPPATATAALEHLGSAQARALATHGLNLDNEEQAHDQHRSP